LLAVVCESGLPYLEQYFDLAWCRNEEGLDGQEIKIILEWNRYDSHTPWLTEDHKAEATIHHNHVKLKAGTARGRLLGDPPIMQPKIIDDARRDTIIGIACSIAANPNGAVNQFNIEAVAHAVHSNSIIVKVFVGSNIVLEWNGDAMFAKGLLGQLLEAMI
jgi:hypothetical protein